jgi:hypothetical protein
MFTPILLGLLVEAVLVALIVAAVFLKTAFSDPSERLSGPSPRTVDARLGVHRPISPPQRQLTKSELVGSAR